MTILLGTMHVTSGVHHIAYQTTAKHISNSQVLLSTERLSFLQKGIVHQLANLPKGHGLAVVLEHRYYGQSLPVADLSTENLRFLSTEQAMADTAYFARKVVFSGLDHLDLTAPKNPYIAYGGSYAGAFVAILRKLYPATFYGAISSSGVTAAVYDFWQYYEMATRLTCSSFVYHEPSKYITTGAVLTSMKPSRKRTAARPPKSWHTACSATTIPQSTDMQAKYLRIGTRCMIKAAGISPPRYPKLIFH